MKKAIIIIVVVIILGGGAWWYFNNSANSAAPVAAAPAALVPTQNVQPAAPAPAGTPNTVTIPASGSSDADLSQEAAEVDTQMNGLNSDSASADNGLSSQ